MIHALSMELFGRSLALPEFPLRKDIRGLGLSDWNGYAITLAEKFDYVNTYYHQEPRLDILDIDASLEGAFDFLISTDVFEHVPPPISVAFQNARRLLKEGGVLLLTVPFTVHGETTREHFPNLRDFRIIERDDGRRVLVNITAAGETETFEDLVFHEGGGLTLEMRLFSEAALVEELRRAGFAEITIHRQPEFRYGVYWNEPEGSLPVAARSAPAGP